MQEMVTLGKNKTGSRMNPDLAKEMLNNSQELTTENMDTSLSIDDLRSEYIDEAGPIGSVPPTNQSELPNPALVQLLDKLGERMAFERSGVRLYEAVLTKCRASKLELPLARLEQIQQQELEHYLLLQTAIEDLGADPTAQTPCADVIGVQSMGLIQTVTDPRTNVAQCLGALLTAELTDNAGWELLMDLARAAGQERTADSFQRALEQEAEHLDTVKTLLRQVLLNMSSDGAVHVQA